MTQKRKANPYTPNLEKAQAREAAAKKQLPAKPTGQQTLARAFAARAQEMIEKNMAAPSIIVGNAIALSRGREALDSDRLPLQALALDGLERAALNRVLGSYRGPGGWAGALQREFDLVWAPKKLPAPGAGFAHGNARPQGHGAHGAATANSRPAAKTGSSNSSNGAGAKTSAPRAPAPKAPAKATVAPAVIIKRVRRVEAPAAGSADATGKAGPKA